MDDDEIKNLVKGVSAEVSRIEGLIPKPDKKEDEGKPEMKKCAVCDGEIVEGVHYCPHCGSELEWS